MVSRAAAVLLALSAAATASTKEDDRVASIPGFESEFQKGLGFDVYSGYLDVQVPKAATGYDSLSIHYELHTCRQKDCPLALWHQGGPGGSAVFGAWTEMGPFQLMAQGPVFNDKNAWNNAAHMLYLESPAGSTIAGSQTGYSTCSIDGKVQDACRALRSNQLQSAARHRRDGLDGVDSLIYFAQANGRMSLKRWPTRTPSRRSWPNFPSTKVRSST